MILESSAFMLNNYLDLLIDDEINEKGSCICLEGVSKHIQEIYLDIKNYYEKSNLQDTLKKKGLFSIYHWKEGYYPLPLKKIKSLLDFWKGVCNKTSQEVIELYDDIYWSSTYFTAQKSPIKIKVLKSVTPKLAYFIGVLYADGSLRDIWLSLRNRKRFQYEITITDKSRENLKIIKDILGDLFEIETNVKQVYSGKWHRLLFNSLILHRLLNKIFDMPMGYKKGKLSIPPLIQNSPQVIKKYFIIGFFDGDGWCSGEDNCTPCVSVSQSDKKILLQIKKTLAEFGLYFNLDTQKRKEHTWYRINIKNKKQIIKFQKEFGFIYPEKKRRLKCLVKSF